MGGGKASGARGRPAAARSTASATRRSPSATFPQPPQPRSEAVALEPYREQAYLKLIKAQAAGGNRAVALHTYERCRRLLAEELGVTPSPQTEAVYLELLGAPTDSSPPPAPPPTGMSPC